MSSLPTFTVVIAQLDRDRFTLGDLFGAAGSGKTFFDLELVILSEGETRNAQTLLRRAYRNFGLGIDLEVVLVLDVARAIELTREDQARFRLRSRRLDFESAEREVWRGWFGRRGDRACAGHGSAGCRRAGCRGRWSGGLASGLGEVTHTKDDSRRQKHDGGKSNQHALHGWSSRKKLRRSHTANPARLRQH
jgi:hypothetical protein